MTNYARVQLQPAYVLHQRPYRDSSAIVEIFSEAYGRRSLIAKGIKRPKSRLRGLVQPFQPLLMSWIGRSELCTLTDAEIYSPSIALKSKYLPSAFYLNELLLKLLHKDDPHNDVFVAYHNTLGQFRLLDGSAENELALQASLRNFETQLLQSIGYGLVLDHDVLTHKAIEADAVYEFVVDRGPVKIENTSVLYGGIRISGNTLMTLGSGQQMATLSRDDNAASRQLFKEAKHLLRAVIDNQLGNKNLHSRDLYTKTPVEKHAAGESTVQCNEAADSRLKVQEIS